MRLDVFLTQKYEGAHTRSQINNAIKSGNVTVNDVVITKSGYEVTDNDKVKAVIETENLTAEPENIPIEIVFEDEHLLIINKPRGMVVHPGAGNHSGTLLNALLYLTTPPASEAPLRGGESFSHKGKVPLLFGGVDARSADGVVERAGIVHRLDKNTAGLMVVAKTAFVQSKLAAMFEKHKVKRIYLGIVEGQMHGEGTIDKNIVRHPQKRTLYTTNDEIRMPNSAGRRAITHFKVLETFAKHSLVQFRLETGRTHQIRVHCKSVGHPIVGDAEYNPKYSEKGGMRHKYRGGLCPLWEGLDSKSGGLGDSLGGDISKGSSRGLSAGLTGDTSEGLSAGLTGDISGGFSGRLNGGSISGQMLESVEIAFQHPVTGQQIRKKIETTSEFKYILSKICNL